MARRHNILFNLKHMINLYFVHLFGRRSPFRKLLYLIEIVILISVFVIIFLLDIAARGSALFVREKVLCDSQVQLLVVFIREHALVMFYLICSLATLLTCLIIDQIHPIVKL